MLLTGTDVSLVNSQADVHPYGLRLSKNRRLGLPCSGDPCCYGSWVQREALGADPLAREGPCGHPATQGSTTRTLRGWQRLLGALAPHSQVRRFVEFHP